MEGDALNEKFVHRLLWFSLFSLFIHSFSFIFLLFFGLLFLFLAFSPLLFGAFQPFLDFFWPF